MQFNIPNILTIIRIIIVPFFIYFLISEDLCHKIISLILFLIASITDFLDGYIARKRGEITEFGKFFDPLADKFLVLSALIVFVVIPDTFVPLWMVLIIILRDVIVTTMRILAPKKGIKFKTSRFGKIKTVVQIGAIIMVLIIIILRTYIISRYKIYIPSDDYFSSLGFMDILKYINQKPLEGLLVFSPYILMLIVTIFTFYSGVRYLMLYWRVFLPVKERKDGDF